MNPELHKIQETIQETQDYYNKYKKETNKLDQLIIHYIELTNEDVEIDSHNDKIEINFKNLPTTKTITKLAYLSKTLKYKFKTYSLTNYAMTTPKITPTSSKKK